MKKLLAWTNEVTLEWVPRFGRNKGIKQTITGRLDNPQIIDLMASKNPTIKIIKEA